MPKKKAETVQTPPVAGEQKDHEKVVQAFLEADVEYCDFEEFISSGQFLKDMFASCRGDVTVAQEEWSAMWDRLRTLLEDRNAKRKSAADALRQAVQLAPTQWRGPDGSPSVTHCGPFQVSSVTSRRFDAQTLFALTSNHGVFERMMQLKTVDKNGKEVPLVQQSWDIDYDGISAWLRANKLLDVLTGAYDETEKTPQVKGPKDLAFLGEKKAS